ncbi:MAG: hypothetical protein IKF01_00565 [Bacilli bacterium]|nr:hypothetical protein [Bacilli bacterium]
MNRHIININGKTFVFYLKGRRLDVFMYKNGPQKVDFTTFKNKNEAKKFLSLGIIEMFKREILENIKNNKYTSIESMEKDFKEKFNTVENRDIKRYLENIKDNKKYIETLNFLKTELQKNIDNVDEKKDMIEKNTDLDLKELFEKNGIFEYEINPSKSYTLIVYKDKNGIPHTVINNNPNIPIYDIIVKSLQFDYANKENIQREIDTQIKDTMEREAKFTYTKNETVDSDKMDDTLNEIKSYVLNTRSDITKVYGIKPSDNKIDGALILETDKGFEPIVVSRENNGSLKVEFPNKKEVSKKDTSTTTKEDTEKENVEDELNKISNEIEIECITSKLNENETITDKERQNLENSIKNIYQKLSSDEHLEPSEEKLVIQLSSDLYDKIIYQTPSLKDILDEIIKSYTPKTNVKENDKVKKIEPPKDKNAFIELTLVTFISGLISGLFVYAFFKMLF